MAELITREFTYQAGDFTVPAYACYPAAGGPGVIVLHAWWGLTPFFKRLCQRLAEAGFAVIAPDLYNGVTADTIEAAQQALNASSFDYMQQALQGVVAQIRRLPGVGTDGLGVIGFSLGAAMSLVLTTALDPQAIAAVVLFYGSETVDFSRTKAAFLGHFAEQDPWEPLENVRSMEAELHASDLKTAFYLYPGVGHWFFEDNRPDAYQPEAAQLAWERTLAFLNDELRHI